MLVLFGLSLLGLGLGAACFGRIPSEELPSEPIAFVRQEPKAGIAGLGEFMGSLRMSVGERPGETGGEEGAAEESEGTIGGRAPKTTISLLTLATGELRSVPDAGFGTYPLDWSADGLYLLIGRTVGDGAGLRLLNWNRLTGALDRIPVDLSLGGAAFGAGPIRLALVGRVYAIGQPAQRGILVQIDRRGVEPLQGSSGGQDPDVAPDGRQVVFTRASKRSGGDPVILLGELGSPEARPIGRGSSPRYSRDGEWITYVRHRRGNADVWLMRSDGAAKRAVAESAFDEEFPAVSPDGRFVVYSAARGGKDQSQLFLTRVADRVEIQITQNGQNGRPVW